MRTIVNLWFFLFGLWFFELFKYAVVIYSSLALQSRMLENDLKNEIFRNLSRDHRFMKYIVVINIAFPQIVQYGIIYCRPLLPDIHLNQPNLSNTLM